MKIVLGRNFSREFNIVEQITILNKIEDELNDFFLSRDYGDKIKQIYIGIICVSSGFESFFPLSSKMKVNKNPPEIEYGVKLDFDFYKSLSKEQMITYIYSEILKRTKIMLPTKNIIDFDGGNFLIDLEEYVGIKSI